MTPLHDHPDETEIPKLTDDILIEIVQRLNIKSLLRLKSVCKSWMDIIESPLFGRVHLDYSKNSRWKMIFLQISPRFSSGTSEFQAVENHFTVGNGEGNNSIRTLQAPSMLYDTYGISHRFKVSTCDGLLLLVDDDVNRSTILLWNPTTKKSRRINPLEPISDWHENSDVITGFGYDSSTQSFKIVRIVANDDFSQHEIRVFTLKNNNWRTIQLQGFPGSYRLVTRQTPAFIDGAIFFLARSTDPGHGRAESKCLALRFNLASERFMDEIPPIPVSNPLLDPCEIVGTDFLALGGDPCLLLKCEPEDTDHGPFELCLLKESGNSNCSWTKIYYNRHWKHPSYFYHYPIEKDQLAFVLQGVLWFFNLVTREMMTKKIKNDDQRKFSYYMTCYVESLVAVVL